MLAALILFPPLLMIFYGVCGQITVQVPFQTHNKGVPLILPQADKAEINFCCGQNGDGRNLIPSRKGPGPQGNALPALDQRHHRVQIVRTVDSAGLHTVFSAVFPHDQIIQGPFGARHHRCPLQFLKGKTLPARARILQGKQHALPLFQQCEGGEPLLVLKQRGGKRSIARSICRFSRAASVFSPLSVMKATSVSGC